MKYLMPPITHPGPPPLLRLNAQATLQGGGGIGGIPLDLI